MIFTDTHSHMYLSQFDADLAESITRALDANVKKIILPNIDSVSLTPLLKTVSENPNLFFPLIGLHPTHVKENYQEELQAVFKNFKLQKFYGIGEIGIDLYWDKTFLDVQKEAFIRQVEISIENNLPVVIHARESFNEIFECLKNINSKKYKGIFHAFSGDTDTAREIIEMGFLLGIGGMVTYKNSNLPDVIKQIDLNHIVLETDSPYLAPMPHRGKRNESAYIPLIASEIAMIKGTSIENVANITSENASLLFNI